MLLSHRVERMGHRVGNQSHKQTEATGCGSAVALQLQLGQEAFGGRGGAASAETLPPTAPCAAHWYQSAG